MPEATSQPNGGVGSPVVFDEFFRSGFEEAKSPFLTKGSRVWAKNLSLRVSLLSAVLLLLAFVFSYKTSLIPASNFLLLLVYFFAGIPSLIDSLEDVGNLEINIDVLMTLAAFMSVVIGSSMEGGLLLVLFSLSGAIEDLVDGRARSALWSLESLAPNRATVVDENGHLFQKSVRDITEGTHILVRSGEVVPLDGKVIEGRSSLDLSHLTGENLPVMKEPGDKCAAGSKNLEGALHLEVQKRASESTLARMIKLIAKAQDSKPRLQRWIDRLEKAYASTIISVSFLSALILPWALGIGYLGDEGSIYRALAFLIAASPCAMVIAVPIAYFCSVGACARKGILLKGGVVLEALAGCKRVAFDKTGTLTKGELHCNAFQAALGEEFSLDEALAVAAGLEAQTVHPIATAVLEKAKEAGIQGLTIQDFSTLPGYGVKGKVSIQGQQVEAYFGRLEGLKEQVDTSTLADLKEQAKKAQGEGCSTSFLKLGSSVYLFSFQDSIREGTEKVLQELRDQGFDLLMLTGDNRGSAKRVGKSLGIDEIFFELLPEDKLEKVSQLATSEGLVMVGDGINDAPALARSTVGISMGQVGSFAAVDASDIVLLHDDLDLMGWLAAKARATRRVIQQNVTLAMGVIVCVSMAALIGFVPLWLAVILHEGGTLLVGLNGLRLLRN